jgi:hypothetical protein
MARRYHRRAPGTLKYEMDQQALEEKTGQREKVVYDNDFGVSPSAAIMGFLCIIAFAMFRKLFAFY